MTPRRGYRKPPTYLRPRERDLLLAAADGHPRDRAILMVMCYAGLRLNETCMLDRADIDFEDRTILVRFAKGGKWRRVGLNPKVAAALTSYLGTRADAEPALFLSGRRRRINWRTVEAMLDRYVAVVPDLAEIDARTPITPHVLRHTFATSLLRATRDLGIVQRAMGHSSIATTSIYLHLADDELYRAMDQL